MSILAGEIRSARRAAVRPSVREVCLLGISRPGGPEWGAGARVTLSGRVYQVEATGASASGREDEAVCYVHLGAVDVEDAE